MGSWQIGKLGVGISYLNGSFNIVEKFECVYVLSNNPRSSVPFYLTARRMRKAGFEEIKKNKSETKSEYFGIQIRHSAMIMILPNCSATGVRGEADDQRHRGGGGARAGRLPARPVPQDLHPPLREGLHPLRRHQGVHRYSLQVARLARKRTFVIFTTTGCLSSL